MNFWFHTWFHQFLTLPWVHDAPSNDGATVLDWSCHSTSLLTQTIWYDHLWYTLQVMNHLPNCHHQQWCFPCTQVGNTGCSQDHAFASAGWRLAQSFSVIAAITLVQLRQLPPKVKHFWRCAYLPFGLLQLHFQSSTGIITVETQSQLIWMIYSLLVVIVVQHPALMLFLSPFWGESLYHVDMWYFDGKKLVMTLLPNFGVVIL